MQTSLLLIVFVIIVVFIYLMTRTKTNKQPYKTNTNKEIDDRNIKEINHIDINKEQRSKYLDQIIKKYTGL